MSFVRKLLKKLDVSETHDCLICATRPGLFLGKINICCASFHCDHHTNSEIIAQDVRPSISCILLCFLFIAFQIVRSVTIRLPISDTLTARDVFRFLETVVIITALMYNITAVMQLKTKIREYTGLISIINDRAEYGLTTLLTNKMTREVHGLLLFTVIVLIVGEFVTTVWTLLSAEAIDSELIMRVIAENTTTLINYSVCVHGLQYFEIYRNLYMRIRDEIKTCLSTCLLTIQIERPFVVKEHNKFIMIPKLKKISLLIRLYVKLTKNFYLNNDSFTQLFLLYLINIIVLLIGLSYLFVIYVSDNATALNGIEYNICIKTALLIALFVAFAFRAQEFYTMNEDLLSYLFKYPISQLTRAEAEQVETLIITLITIKPKLRSTNDMLTIDTKLLASVAGTVLTYALVALQLRASLIK